MRFVQIMSAQSGGWRYLSTAAYAQERGIEPAEVERRCASGELPAVHGPLGWLVRSGPVGPARVVAANASTQR